MGLDAEREGWRRARYGKDGIVQGWTQSGDEAGCHGVRCSEGGGGARLAAEWQQRRVVGSGGSIYVQASLLPSPSPAHGR